MGWSIRRLLMVCLLFCCWQSSGGTPHEHSDAGNSHHSLDSCRGLVPGGWQALRNGFQLMSHYQNQEVARYLPTFSRYYFYRFEKRILKYQAYLNRRVQERSLPAELALLPLIESSLDSRAKSSARAAGLWQLMPKTARVYGLEVSAKRDERKDVEKSTEAALTLLEDLYQRTDDWLLTIAAYNAGLYRVRKSVARSGKNRGDFWGLELPRETRGHVAKLLALSWVVLSPEQHGISLPDLLLSAPARARNISVSLCDRPVQTCLYCRRMALWVFFILLKSAQSGSGSDPGRKRVMTVDISKNRVDIHKQASSTPHCPLPTAHCPLEGASGNDCAH